jgi:uncharacterized protein (TIGR02147 family)
MIFKHSNYRDFLKSTYVERTRRNAKYSLRSFAKQIGLSPAGLSRIFKGDKNLSLDRSVSIAEKLMLSKAEAEYFFLLVQFEQTKKVELKSSLQDRLRTFRTSVEGAAGFDDLSFDYFQVLSDWYSLPILEVLQIPGFEFSSETISKFFGIKKIEAEMAIDRLKRLELLEITPGGKPVRLKNYLLVSSKIPSEAIRKYYKQIAQKVTDSIDGQSPQQKVIGTETFAFDCSQIEEARAITENYFTQMKTLAQKSRNRTDIYQVFVNFFRLNQLEGKRKEK